MMYSSPKFESEEAARSRVDSLTNPTAIDDRVWSLPVAAFQNDAKTVSYERVGRATNPRKPIRQ